MTVEKLEIDLKKVQKFMWFVSGVGATLVLIATIVGGFALKNISDAKQSINDAAKQISAMNSTISQHEKRLDKTEKVSEENAKDAARLLEQAKVWKAGYGPESTPAKYGPHQHVGEIVRVGKDDIVIAQTTAAGVLAEHSYPVATDVTVLANEREVGVISSQDWKSEFFISALGK